MAIWTCTDASFLSRPKSGSVAGFSVGLRDYPPYTFLTHPQKATDKTKESNRPLLAFYNPTHSLTYPPLSPTTLPFTPSLCQRIPVVVAFVAEAEYATTFGGGQVLVELTLTLTNLGHPQLSPYPIRRQQMRDRSCDFFG
jgi:hypothetical protein